MALSEKYGSLIDMARAHGNIVVDDKGDVLHVTGTVNSEASKQSVWEEYGRLDPDMGSGDLVLDLQVVEGGEEVTYEVKSGDSLSKIATHYEGVSWKEIFEANRDQLDDPDKIHPGQKLRIPKG